MGSNEKIIIQTLLYSDIFDYPLTKKELWLYLHTSHPISMEVFERALQESAFVSSYSDYFFVNGRKALVKRRLSLQSQNKMKMQIGAKVAKLLSILPSIELIGVSGSVAMQSAKEDDDIDLFIITKPHTLWLTRFFILLLLQMTQLRRKRSTKDAKNKICVNMMMEGNNLTFSKIRQTIYTAHEIVQMKILFAKDTIYDQFLSANAWGGKYLYNGFPSSSKQYVVTGTIFFSWFEKLAKFFQIWYMKSHRTREEVAEGFVAFHPIPYEDLILKKYRERKKEYEI